MVEAVRRAVTRSHEGEKYRNGESMGFVATAHEVENWHWRPGTAGGMLSEILRIPFTTSGEFARINLPPCFENPEEEVNGLVAIRRTYPSHYEMYELCAVRIETTFRDYTGMYDLALITSGDMPVTVGRELLGECKKMGRSTIVVDGHHVTGTTVREGGEHLVTISGELNDTPEEPGTHEYNQLDLLAILNEKGVHFHNDPEVATLERIEKDFVVRSGTGTLSFTENANVPLHTIPILETGPIRYSLSMVEFTPMVRHGVITEESGQRSEDYLPYVLPRSYDLFSDPTPFHTSAGFLTPAEQDRLNGLLSK